MYNNQKVHNIKDIAKLAGVSHTTVSRVINNSSIVTPDTRKKIMSLIEKTGYTPNIVAKGLISGKTYNIGLLVMYNINQYPSDYLLPALLEGMAPIFNMHNYSLTLIFNESYGYKNNISIKHINRNRMDALLILLLENSLELTKSLLEIDLPKIYINIKPENTISNFVIANEYEGAVSAVEHLIKEGHTKIGFIGGTPNVTSSIDRKMGYVAALERNGIIYSPYNENVGYYNIDKGYEAMKVLLNKNPKLTAVFLANDLMAMGAIKAIKENGMKVPDDIAIVGYDNQEFAKYMEPSLTTVKKPRTLMGQFAAEKIIDSIKTKSSIVEGIVLPTELIIRESSKKK